jgi:NTP pyrophosphatase (non-canonical NTP hydrolase)
MNNQMTMDELVRNVEQWAIAKGLDSSEYRSRQALKVMEEVGETMAALARGQRAELRDGIGDSIVTLIILALQSGLSATECLQCAYDEIKGRTGKVVDGVFVKSSM